MFGPILPRHQLQRGRRGGLVVALVGAAALVAAAPAFAAPPLLLTGYRSWTLADLGLRTEIVYRARPLSFRPTSRLAFRLPANAREGAGSWYVLHLHIRAYVAPHPPAHALTYVGAASDEVGAALIRFRLVGPAGQRAVETTSVSLITGTTRRVSRSGMIELRFDNYLPILGVHPGRNLLQLSVGPPSGALLERVVFLRDSALSHVRTGPAVLQLTAGVSPTRLRAGVPATVHVRLANVGGTAARQVAVAARVVGGGGEITSPGRRIGRLPPHRSATVAFSVRPSRPGQLLLAFTATARNGGAGATVRLHVVSP